MKRNLALIILLAALVITAVFVRNSNNRALSGNGVKLREKLLPGLPLDGTIRKIHVREGDKNVTVSIPKDKWVVAERNDYPAAVDKIKRLLTSLADLKIARGVPVKKDALGAIKLLGPDDGPADSSGLLVEMFNEKGDVVQSFVVGKSIESTGGASSGSFNGPAEQRFVRVMKDEGTAWVVSESFSEIQPDPKEWVDKSFVDVRKLKSVDITAANAADSWGAERKDENSEFTLLNAKNGDSLDTAKASGLSNLLSNPTFSDVLPKDKVTPDFMKGAISAKITTFEGFTYDVKLLEKKEGGETAEAKDYLSFTVTANIAKERKAPADEKPEDKKKNDDAFEATKKDLEAKLAKEKALEGRIFELGGFYVTMLTKKRSEVLRDKPQPPAGPEIKVPQPGALPAPAAAPRPAPKPTTTVTTPPVSIPAPEKKEETPKPEAPKPDASKADAK